MDEVAQHLVVDAAHEVDASVKIKIKFPNWYDHFQGSGYGLDKEPEILNAIYTRTETRDPVITDQLLQQYESYQIFRYFRTSSQGETARIGRHI